MASYSLLVLPAIAAILIFQGTWLDNGFAARGRPKKYQRRLKAKVLIHRSLIVSLLLSTFIVFTSSLTVLSHLVQGLVLTVILMLPVLVYLLLAQLFTLVRQWRIKKTPPAIDTFEQHVLQGSTRHINEAAQAPLPDSDVPTLNQVNPELASQFRADESRQAKLLKKHHYNSSVKDPDSAIDHTLSLDEQMDNIDRSVDHADIGAEALESSSDLGLPQSTPQANIPRRIAFSAAENNVESNPALPTADQETTPATNHSELTEMVVRLQNEKMKLQKLVIAQKAVIETERQRNRKAQAMTQDAMTAMRSTQKKAIDAIGIAQRERRERLRLEAENVQARIQLEDTNSAKRIIKSVNG